MFSKHKNTTPSSYSNIQLVGSALNSSGKRIKNKPLFLVAIITLSLFASLIQPLTTKAISTSDSDPRTFSEQVKSILYFKSIQYCLQNAELSTDPWLSGESITVGDAESGKWFDKTQVSTGVAMKNTVSGMQSSGYTYCDNTSLIKGAINLWGLSAPEILCNSGFKREGATSGDCVNGNTSFVRSDNANKTVSDFGNFIKSRVYNNKDIKLTPAQSYVFYLYSLGQNCVSNLGGVPGIDSGYQKPSSTKYENSYDLAVNGVGWADTSVNPAVRFTGYEQGFGSYVTQIDKSNLSSYIMPWADKDLGYDTLPLFNNGSNHLSDRNYGQGTRVSCSTIAKSMTSYVDAYIGVYNKWAEEQSPKVIEEIIGKAEDSSNSQATGETTSCSIEAVGWIVCPVVKFLSTITDWSFRLLADNFLSTKAEILTGVDGSNPTYDAWKAIRNIANVAFVIFFLIIIFSQITSFGITNYGIKKMLPRLVIAAVLVNISFFICQIAVDISNIVGYSAKETLSSIVPPAETIIGSTDGGGALDRSSIFGNIVTAAITGSIAWAYLGAIIPVMLAAGVALVMILLILVARQALIILLIVLSPLAFVAFLLPNTSDLFKKWRKAFMAMLMLYPIVSLVFGASIFASNILFSVFKNNDEWMGKIISAAVLVLPLFVVPGLLKKSLDSVGTIGTKINGLGDKLGSGLGNKYKGSAFNKYREGIATDKSNRISTGTYRGAGGSLNPNNWRSNMNRRLNKSGAFNTVTGGFGAHRDLGAQAQDLKDSKEATALFGGDDVLTSAWAETGGNLSQLKIWEQQNGALSDARKGQYERLRQAGHQHKATSFFAAAEALSSSGKASASTVISALSRAKAAGATNIDISSAQESAIAAYRSSGRGDALADLSTAIGRPLTQEAGWAQVAASGINREGIKSTVNSQGVKTYSAGAISYANYLKADRENTRKALAGFDKMEARAQALAQEHILSAAQGFDPTITTIQEAKRSFGVIS